ncbi:MAG: PAS domain S-box protein, partial [Gemmatimonadales bacterium]|nr:PAS domain S-box protein [Gemmatimonadales bacterium]
MVESNASERRAEAPRRIATLFRNLVDLCPDAMGVVAEGEIVLLNAAGARLFGAPSSDDLIGRRIIDFVHPDSRDYFLAQVSVLTGPGRETRFEHRAVRLDGSEVDLEVAASATDLDGRPAVQFVARDVTERKRTEERLRLFVAAVDAAPDGVQLVDLEGRVLYSNRAVEDIYGYSPEELRGRHVNEMNADPTFAEQVILPTLRREGRWDGELAVKHKDGHVFPVWLTASIAGGGAGEAPLALVGIIRDVTERKRLEEALRASEERFRLIAENAHDLVSRFRLTPPRGYEYVSPAAFRITGYAPEEFYADPDLGVKIVHPDDRGLLEAALLRPEEFDQPILQRWTRKDGTVIWSEQRVAPVYDDSGQLVAVESIARDISDRKRAEEQAQAERDRFEAMVETSPVGVLVAEARSGRIAFVNQEAQRILGVVRRDADRLDRLAEAATYLRPDGAPYDVMDLPLQRALYRGESTRAEEILLELPDGRTVPTLVNATPIYGADGEIESAIAIIQDISPIEELERLRNDFLAMVSHELRTPLTAIKGAAATALESGVDLRSDEAQDLFRIVDDQVSRLRDLVSNLMDITRIDAGALS